MAIALIVCNLLVVVTFFYTNFFRRPDSDISDTSLPSSTSRSQTIANPSNDHTMITFTEISTQNTMTSGFATSVSTSAGGTHTKSTFPSTLPTG